MRRRRVRAAASLLLLALVAAPACGDDAPEPVAALFDVGVLTSDDPARFYDLPFPSDLRRDDTGHLLLTGFPAQAPLVQAYAAAAARDLDGWGLNSAVYFRFDGALDGGSLPDAAASVLDDAALYLVNVDAASPSYGERTPVLAHFTADGYKSTEPNLLAILPYPGFPLREGTTYAAVITSRVHDAHDQPLRTSDAWEAVRDGAPGDEGLTAAYAPLWDYLADGADARDARADVVAATVFTTQHATDMMPKLRQAIWQLPAPTAAALTRTSERGTKTRYEGTYDAPNFQRGVVPYTNDGGDIVLGDDGLPVVQVTETLRFAVTVPDGPTPPTGWPIVLYEHGTGGDYLSFVDDGTAESLAQAGLAAISMDQVLHGPRNPGGNPEVDFFNFINPLTARDNVAQGAADGFSLTRLATGLAFHDRGRQVFFDPARVYFFGHSQGSTTGGPFVPFEPSIKATVFSGAGGVLTLTLLTKTEPFDIPGLVVALARDEPLDEWNPTLTLLQTWAERADAVNYAAALVREPPPMPAADGGPGDGTPQAPKALFQTDGIVDHYAPNVNGRAYFTAVGGDLVGPQLEDVPGLTLRGRQVQAAPLANNLNGATAALLQYAGDEGHFVVFDVAAARFQSTQFLATHAATGTATVVEP